ncbi:MAG TPA: RNA 2',3'-cyclic phosphodiesterase [Syntrophomonas sp.]|jgi:2'-5' RNA ligase|nr:RNA 2',3'-cyclic phosphodiesterase [Syntrophomonas sp.]
MRAFIAIPAPEAVKDQAEQIRRQLARTNPDVKWVEYVNYHLTLKFLGDIDDHQLQKIRDRLYQVGEYCPPFYLKVNGLSFFPNKRKPRVVWMGLDGDTEKAEFLAERIDVYVQDLGFEPEKIHRFHITLGRIRSERNVEELLKKAHQLESATRSSLFPVQAFYLMESRLTKDGPQYRVEQAFALRG